MPDDERVAVFIDGSNFYHALKADFGDAKIDFQKFVGKLVDARRLVRIYYYNAPVDQTRDAKRAADQQRFFDQLQRVPYLTLKLGRLESRGPVQVEKGVDIVIAVDLLRFAHSHVYDMAIIVSGDSDFVPAVEAVQDLGKHVEMACSHSGRSDLLRKTRDRIIEITEDLLADCWLDGKRHAYLRPGATDTASDKAARAGRASIAADPLATRKGLARRFIAINGASP